MLPSSSLAAIGRVSSLLRLPAASRCSIFVALQEQQYRTPLIHQQHRCASTKLKTSPKIRPRLAQNAPSSSSASSASSQTLAPTSSSASDTNPYDFSDKINPPSTTLPAPLDVPTRKTDQGTISYYASIGKAYWGFYKTGVKNVWKNAGERRRLVRRKRFDKKTPPPDMKDTKQNAVLDERALGQYTNYPFTRAEFQFFTRSWRDAKRIPIFAILLAIFGEYLPLVVIFCTPLVPYPCRIPKQIRKAREQLEERRSRSFRGEMGDVPVPLDQNTQSIEQLNAAQINHIGRSLGLYFNFWDRIGAAWPPQVLLKRRLKKRLEYLQLDDELFRRDGGVKLLQGDEELRIAAEERGIDVLNKSTDEIHRLLEAWEANSGQGKTVNMLLSR